MNPMNTPRWTLAILAAALLGTSGGYWFAQRTHGDAIPSASPERTVLYWYDPMVPNQHFDKPGKSPFMDMPLVPKYAGDDTAASAGIQIDPGILQNLGVRLATVQRGVLSQPLDALGNIGFNQRDVAVVQARTNGFVTRVYQRAPGDVIARNAPLVDVLVPEWTGAQAEFLALLNSNDAALIDAARQRLMLLGMPAELIASIEQTRQQHATITIHAPIAGVIDSLEVRTGMTLNAGATLATLNGIDTVWLEAQIPETQSGSIGVGRSVTATLAAYPGETFTGKIIAILPQTDLASRTLRARIELANPQQRLRPGQFARVHMDGGDRQPVLYVPSEAVIRSGVRSVVIVTQDGRFNPVEVQLGAESGDSTIVLSGVEEGQQVVASGQFLIDSEANLQGVLTRLNGGAATSASAAAATRHTATGKIESVASGEIVISHGPVTSLGWSAMTMPFRVAHPGMLGTLQAGDAIEFEFEQQDDRYVLHSVERAP